MNHIWLRHFGQALSPRRPTSAAMAHRRHIRAARLARRGIHGTAWSMKGCTRLIVTSSTYRMASTPDPADAKIDPDNHFSLADAFAPHGGGIVRDNLL